MKTTNLGILLALATLNLGAQGTIRFENNIPGVLVTHIYAVNLIFPFRVNGNGPLDFPPGDRDWTGWTPAAGSGFSAQLLAAPGENVHYSSLRPASAITSFQTGANAGFVVPLITALEGVPADAPVATVMMFAWDNQGGTVNTWEEAVYNARTWYGGAGPFNVNNLGGTVSRLRSTRPNINCSSKEQSCRGLQDAFEG
jgi:hypothetical protein